MFIPLIAVSRGYLVSEVSTGEAALLKIATLRTLIAAMTILWLIELSLKYKWSNWGKTGSRLSSLAWLRDLVSGLRDKPVYWVVAAVLLYAASVLISTILSGSFGVSLWGAVPGQDSYATYTIASYLILFGIVSTHLKTPAQLWRLIGVIVVMGVLFGSVAVWQHYAADPLRLMGQSGGSRVTATVGNPIFAGSVLLITITTTLMAALINLREPVASRGFWFKLSLWVPFITIQALAMTFTLSRGPWLGTILALFLVLALIGTFVGRRVFGKATLVLGLAGFLTVAVLLLSSGFQSAGDDAIVSGRFATISSEVSSGRLGYRPDIWGPSWRLATQHPWFEFDDLSLEWLRPIIGYGPDLYRFTYLLESRPWGSDLVVKEAHHAHNYFLHQTVELGFLGLLSSTGIIVAVTLGGVYLLLRNPQGYTTWHKVVLIALIAMVVGRALEQMVGLARVSDLTLFWVLLAIFVALPTISSGAPFELSGPERVVRRKAPKASRPTFGRGNTMIRSGVWLGLVCALAIATGVFTWHKTISYAVAGREVAKARESLRKGELLTSLERYDRGIKLAPENPLYYKFKLELYVEHLAGHATIREPDCHRRDQLGISTYSDCLNAQSYSVALKAAEKQPLYGRSHLDLANLSNRLSRENPEAYPLSQAILSYQKIVQLMPYNWRFHNKLASAYLESGDPAAALVPIEESLQLTQDTRHSDKALYLRGRARVDLGHLVTGAEDIEHSLRLNPSSSWAAEAHRILATVYRNLGNADLAEDHTRLSKVSVQG